MERQRRVLDLLLCKYSSLGFRAGVHEKRTRTRKAREGRFSFYPFYPGGIQTLGNVHLDSYFASKSRDLLSVTHPVASL